MNTTSNKCITCKIQFGEYHCNICNLWMDNKDQPFHCNECKICRVGGKDRFTHCSNCEMCIDNNVFHTHRCHDGKYTSNCPVCYEDLFTSRSESHELPCGHVLHWQCFCDLSDSDVRCPICKKTILDEDERTSLWERVREEINHQQDIPLELMRVVDVFCNDCEQLGSNQRWHPLGVSCLHCGGFNTSLDIKLTGDEAVNYLLETGRGGSL